MPLEQSSVSVVMIAGQPGLGLRLSHLPTASEIEQIELEDLTNVVDRAGALIHEAETILTEEEDTALKTITDPPLGTPDLKYSIRELRGRANNLAKLKELDDHIALEK